jgi:hypothetical protein
LLIVANARDGQTAKGQADSGHDATAKPAAMINAGSLSQSSDWGEQPPRMNDFAG